MLFKDATKSIVRVLLQNLAQAVSSGQYAQPLVKGVGLRPAPNRGALFKLCVVTVSSLYLGGFLAHKGASYLEENEIFVPSDDDDDDD
ncbi:Essential MCU regulator mitochondrial [Trichostrongylus colubriformis]|uniref:Essential MCU regulator, mitochondrial n=1 Tax=Trichostrongylus colubriformis TaxID=6319 RepID=A0AAN8IPJ9_TRICO